MRRWLAVAIAMAMASLAQVARSEVLVGVVSAMTGRLAWIGEQARRWLV